MGITIILESGTPIWQGLVMDHHKNSKPWPPRLSPSNPLPPLSIPSVRAIPYSPAHPPTPRSSTLAIPAQGVNFPSIPSRPFSVSGTWYIASLANRGLAHAFPLCPTRVRPPFRDVCAGPGRSRGAPRWKRVERGMHSDRGLHERHAGMAECVKFRKRKGKVSAPAPQSLRTVCMKLKLF